MNKDHYHYMIGPFWSIFLLLHYITVESHLRQQSYRLQSTVERKPDCSIHLEVSKNNFRELGGEATYCYSIRGIYYVGDGGKRGGESNNLSDNGTGGMGHILFLDAFNTPALILKTQC